MNYAVMVLNEIQGKDSVKLVANGNKYYVYYKATSGESYSSNLDLELEDALVIFEKFVEAFAYGDGNEKWRANLLKG